MRCPASSPRSGPSLERGHDRDARPRRRRARSSIRVVITFPDLVIELKARLPDVRGRLMANQPLAELTWFRVGGPAQVLFMPDDEADLSYLLAHLPPEIPATVIGLGSNLIVRDGGVPGVVIRLGRGFSHVAAEEGARVRA